MEHKIATNKAIMYMIPANIAFELNYFINELLVVSR